MKKRILLLALVLAFALVLCACGCKHETWTDADCVNPKTCADCGETEGAPLGHTWAAATCETAKTCEVCGEVEGEPLGHSWVDATCETAKTCERCGLTEGEALGHSWVDATTEAPKTCSVCALTEGERIVTDPRFTTAANEHLFGKWQANLDMPVEEMDPELAPYGDTLPVTFYFDFHNDGTLSVSLAPADNEAMSQIMNDFTVDMMYKEFADMGLNKAQSNAAMKEAYGMSVEEYVAAEVKKMDFAELFTSFSVEYVYYVDGETMYLGYDWDEMEPDTYKFEDGVLYLPVEGEEPVAFTPVAE